MNPINKSGELIDVGDVISYQSKDKQWHEGKVTKLAKKMTTKWNKFTNSFYDIIETRVYLLGTSLTNFYDVKIIKKYGE